MYLRRTLVWMILLVLGTIPLHGAAIDSTLYTYYNSQPPFTSIGVSVCGSLPQSEGCYGGGALGPFGLAGSMLEGAPVQSLKNGTVTRYIYVVDVAAGSGANDVVLYVYKKVDTITPSDDSVSISLYKTITLSLAGGTTSTVYMAANKNYLFVGTNQNGTVAQVKKSNLAVSEFGTGNPALSAITADAYGYIAVTWEGGYEFAIINTMGEFGADGGGSAFMLNTTQGTVPSAVP